MAVTITVEDLASAIRAGTSARETAIVTRLLAVGTALVEEHAPAAPQAVKDEAVVRIAGYLFDQPASGARQGYASAFRNSGARALLLPWRVKDLGVVGAVAG